MGCVAGGGAGLREADLDLEAAVGSRLDGEGGVVCGGDGFDDREPEADAVAVIGSVRTDSVERLEKELDLIGRDDRPAVCDRDNGTIGFGRRLHIDAASRVVVADSVVDEVGDQPLGESGIA